MKDLRNSESGIISIFVATLLIVILSLLVLAFAQISRREQRQSLDTQLSSQAFYAAESGVNDARSKIATFTAGTAPSKTTCQNDSNYTFTGNLNADGSVNYSCVLINTTPTVLPVTAGSEDQVIPLKPVGGAGLGTLSLSWRTGNAASAANCPTAGSFPPATSSGWKCAFGGIRIDLVDVSGGYTRAALAANTMTAFLMPQQTSGSGSVGFRSGGAVTKGAVVGASGCNTSPYTCTVTITGLSSNTYYLRYSSIYKTSNLAVSTPSGSTHFAGAQAQVDVTGKANDVLRRIVVAVPLEASNDKVANQALVSGGSVCKKFKVNNGLYLPMDTGGSVSCS